MKLLGFFCCLAPFTTTASSDNKDCATAAREGANGSTPATACSTAAHRQSTGSDAPLTPEQSRQASQPCADGCKLACLEQPEQNPYHPAGLAPRLRTCAPAGSLLNEHPFKKTSQDRLSVARQGLEQLVMDLRFPPEENIRLSSFPGPTGSFDAATAASAVSATAGPTQTAHAASAAATPAASACRKGPMDRPGAASRQGASVVAAVQPFGSSTAAAAAAAFVQQQEPPPPQQQRSLLQSPRPCRTPSRNTDDRTAANTVPRPASLASAADVNSRGGGGGGGCTTAADGVSTTDGGGGGSGADGASKRNGIGSAGGGGRSSGQGVSDASGDVPSPAAAWMLLRSLRPGAKQPRGGGGALATPGAAAGAHSSSTVTSSSISLTRAPTLASSPARGHGMTHGSVTQIVGADGGGDGDHDNGPGASASVAATTPGPAPLRTSPLAPVTSLDFGAADACRTPRQTRRVWRKGEVAAAATTAGATGNGGAGAGAGGASTAAAPTGGNILITGLKNADCGSSGSRSIGDGTCSVSFGGLAGPIWGLGTAAGAEGEEDEEEEEDGVFDDCAGGVTSLSQQTGGEEETGDPAVAQDLAGLLGTGTESAASALRRSASVPMFAMERPGELEGMGLAAGNTGGGGAVRTRFTNRPISFLSKRSPGKSQLSTTGWHTPRARLPVLRRCSTAAPGGGGGGADAGGGDGATAVCTRRPHLRTVNAGAGWGSRHLSGSSSRSGHVLLPSGTAAGGGGSGGMVCGVLLLSGGGAGGGVEGSEQKDSCSGSKILWPPGLQPLPPPPPLLARVLNLGRGVAGGTAAVAAAAAMVPPDPVPYNSKPAATLQEATATMPTGPPHGFVAASGGQRHPPYASKHMSQMALLPFLQQQQQQSSSTLLPVALSAPGSFNLAALSREITGLRWIGQGGGGAVFQGMWQGVSVAVKFLLTEADGLVDAAALEGVVSSVVHHPNVLHTYAFECCRLTEASFNDNELLTNGGGSAEEGGTELLESLMESCTTFSDSNNHVRRARALHIAASGGNFGAFALASCPGGGSGGVCAAVQRLSRLGVPSLGELGPLTSAQLAPPCSTDGGGGEVVTPGGAGRSWGAPLLASCRARSIPPGSSRTLGTAAAAAAATATAVTPVAASPDTSAGAAAAGTAAGVAVETAADAAVGPPTARGGGGLPRALRSWFVDIWGQQSPPVIQPSPPLLRHPQPPSSPSRSASLMAMLRARSQVRQGHPPSPSASGPAVALAVATGTDESDADVVIARSGGDGCFRPASAAAALGRGRGSGSGSAAVTVTAAAAAAGSAHAAAVDSTSYGPVIGSLFSGASTAAGWNCHAKLNSTFHSDDGFGDPEAGMGTQCWTVRQVLSYLKARPGMYLTYIIMEYCDRGSLLSAIKRGVFQTDSMWPHDKDKDKDGLGGGAGGGGGSTGTGTGGGGGGGGAWSLWTSSTTFGRNNLTAPPNRPPRNTATTTTTATITATASPASSITVALPTAEFPLGLHDQQQQQQQQLSSAPSGTASSSRRVVLRALLRTARDVAQGMCHLHSNGIIHGDLKPGNVLLRGCRSDRRGFTALVSDFGLSKVTRGEKPLDLNHWSTVTVMAPEVINGTWLKASDVFSFGILLWQLVTGEIMPYGTCTVPQILVGVSQGSLKPEWPSSAHPALVRLGRACLSTSPEKRPKFEAIVKMLTKIEKDVRSQLLQQSPAPRKAPAALSSSSSSSAAVAAAAGMGTRAVAAAAAAGP